ncbi:MAG: TIGR02281 family clan AA aspartic protease [Magnetococcales bacterium]|nr:TIGR02281 family clan AA aspartic protease [Magnetococcales bacterium]
MLNFRFIVVFCLASALALFLNYQLHGDLLSDGSRDRLGYALGSILILSWLFSSNRGGRSFKKIKLFVSWLLFLFVIIALYSYRGELGGVKNRVVAAIIPQAGYTTEPGSMSFYRSSNGHFHIEAIVNGKKVRFLVDTGASDVVIAPHVARYLGFDLNKNDFTKVYYTANGMGKGAPVFLRKFEVGKLSLQNLPASVNGAEMKTSLLGMRFFNRLKSFKVEGEVLTLYW